MIRTYDNQLHNYVYQAERHLKHKYSTKLSKLSHKLHQKKYTEICEIIDEHLDLFLELKEIKDDTKLIDEKELDNELQALKTLMEDRIKKINDQIKDKGLKMLKLEPSSEGSWLR